MTAQKQQEVRLALPLREGKSRAAAWLWWGGQLSAKERRKEAKRVATQDPFAALAPLGGLRVLNSVEVAEFRVYDSAHNGQSGAAPGTGGGANLVLLSTVGTDGVGSGRCRFAHADVLSRWADASWP